MQSTIPFALAMSLVLLLASLGGALELGQYISLSPISSNNGRDIRLRIHRQKMLSDFYAGVDASTKVIHADSMRINGVCNGVDVHFITTAFKQCETDFRGDPARVKSCKWNVGNTIQSADVSTERALIGSFVRVELYDKKNCQVLTGSGTITVTKDGSSPRPNTPLPPPTPSASPSSAPAPKQKVGMARCIRVNAVQRTGGKKVVFAMNIQTVLNEHHEGGTGRCGKFTFVSSVSVNGVCGDFNAHTFNPADFNKCKGLKGADFRKCFWTWPSMTKAKQVPATNGYRGAVVKVQTYRDFNCNNLWDTGFVTVQ